MNYINDIFIALVGLLTAFLVRLIEKKTKEITASTKNNKVDKYIEMLSSTITECVISTNQVYVDVLKKNNKFNEKEQKEAFAKTYENIMSILSEDAIECLAEVYGDLTLYITTRIEAEVKKKKEEWY